jgi:hypothetical protein
MVNTHDAPSGPQIRLLRELRNALRFANFFPFHCVLQQPPDFRGQLHSTKEKG